MPERPLSIVNQPSPQYCPFCQKADAFNPATSFCARCLAVAPPPPPEPPPGQPSVHDWDRAEYFRRMNEKLRENQSLLGDDDSPMNSNPFLIASGRTFWIGMFVIGIIGMIFLSVLFQDPGAGNLKYSVLGGLAVGVVVLVVYLAGGFSPRPPQPPPSSHEKFPRRDK